MCGEPLTGIATKPFRHTIECACCGEPFEVEGDPNVPMPEFKRPFWTDQFRPDNDDADRPPAALDGLMVAIVTIFGLAIVAMFIVSMIGPAKF